VRAGGSVTQFVLFVLVFRGMPVRLSVAGVDGWLVVAKGVSIGTGIFVNYLSESLLIRKFKWSKRGGPDRRMYI
jgi:hypothetical protein